MIVDFVAGLFGGAAGVLVGHPFDTVKVHLQTDDPKNPKYKGTFHCLKTILYLHDVRGLYRGISSPMMGIGLVNAIVFGVYGNVQRLSDNPNSLLSHFCAGATAGIAQSFICSPMELAKTRLQLSTQIDRKHKFKGPIDCLLYIHKTEGFRGTFKGLAATILRDIPGFASYFVSYEFIMQLNEKPNVPYILAAGACAGMASWLACYPIDVIKTHMQADALGQNAKYNGFIDCAIKNYKHEGITFFFRGLNSTLIRAIPMNAACFFVVAWVLEFCKKNGIDMIVNSPEPLNIVNLENLTQTYLPHELKTDDELVRKIISDNAIGLNESSHDDLNGSYKDYYQSDKIYDSKLLSSQLNLKTTSSQS